VVAPAAPVIAPAVAALPQPSPAPIAPSVALPSAALPSVALPSVALPSAAPSIAAPPSATPPPVIAKRWLLTIGVANYSNVIGIAGAGTHHNDLEGTPTDVANVQSTLKVFGFDDPTTIKLFDATATTRGVRDALDRLRESVGSDDIAVLYISGHGMERNFGRTGETMPLLYDSNVRDTSNTLDFADLVKRFAQIPARQLVMLIDTCHSGGATSDFATVTISSRGVEVSHSGGSPDLARVLRGVKVGRGDFAVMSAAKTDESALDLGPKRGGLFTSNLLKGLQETSGAAPLEDVYKNYVWAPVVQFCRDTPAGVEPCQQTPVLGYDGAGNLIRLAGKSRQ
jgi:caspase domain-containing protein